MAAPRDAAGFFVADGLFVSDGLFAAAGLRGAAGFRGDDGRGAAAARGAGAPDSDVAAAASAAALDVGAFGRGVRGAEARGARGFGGRAGPSSPGVAGAASEDLSSADGALCGTGGFRGARGARGFGGTGTDASVLASAPSDEEEEGVWGCGSDAVIAPKYQRCPTIPWGPTVRRGLRQAPAPISRLAPRRDRMDAMAEKVHRIHSLPDDAPWKGGLPPAGSEEHPRTVRMLDRVLAIQRPAVLAHLRSIRLRHPDATPADVVKILERRYLMAVTTGGAAVGATAVVPGVGTGVTLALSGVETAGFLEATALFAQSIAEVHGVAVDDPDRARALVLTLLMGKEGIDLVQQLAAQAGGRGTSRSSYWGEMVTKTLPRAAVGPLVDRLKTTFARQFATRGGASWIGKALPFGVGAVVGGAGNNILGRRVLTNSRRAFGVAPPTLPAELEPRPGAARLEHAAVHGVQRLGGAIVGAVGGLGRRTGSAARKALPRRRRDDDPDDAAS